MMTGEQYVESLRKLKTVVYAFGERLDNFVDHPLVRPHINAAAATYDMAHDPEFEDLVTATSHLTGEKINVAGKHDGWYVNLLKNLLD